MYDFCTYLAFFVNQLLGGTSLPLLQAFVLYIVVQNARLEPFFFLHKFKLPLLPEDHLQLTCTFSSCKYCLVI